jgi:cytochrome c-type biogenesis protein CcmE
MTRTQRYRLFGVLGVLVGIGAVIALGTAAFRANLMYFYTPSDLLAADSGERRVRLGGVVEVGSVQRGEGLAVDFVVADCQRSLPVRYEGILPDLFREGQGIVASGRWQEGRFIADEVLAKHDENYMPPELAASLMTETGHACEPFKSMISEAS